MSKRFTDTALWEEAWFLELSSKYKLFWVFIKDRCDGAGVWPINERNLKHYIGEKIDIQDALIELNMDDSGQIVCYNRRANFRGYCTETVTETT